ncbi:hsp90 co-chaperone Cdc37 [Toxorhynchites rutilus septentrionalis]|uniref:hsp90 co-chaperone Cdc37 n=1 Tax=Toxorhynchites rutilus septentrionalis TaxID=329112 RepID=UPI00247A92FD|nr:hsp90 co-chaperone Cdc37 [Toxorhynchites rutilus septentrionalis]
MVDYSKWKNIEISDDEDDTHPNIDTPSLFRWRHQARVERMEEQKREKEQMDAKKRAAEQKMKEIKQKLDKKDGNLEELKKSLDELEMEQKRVREEEEMLLKKEQMQPWNVDTISKDGFKKTVINKSAINKKVELTEDQKELNLKEFIKKYEKELKHYGMMRKYDDSKKYLRDNHKLVCEDTANYLVIWCIELEMQEKHELMAHVAHQCICMQYILDISKQLDVDPRACVESFFQRIQIAEAEYKNQFLAEIEAFKERIRKRAQEKLQKAIEEQEEEERKARLGPGGLDPVEVFESLPKELQTCFETRDIGMLQEAMSKLPEDEARVHLQRCIDSGLWVPDANKAAKTDATADKNSDPIYVTVPSEEKQDEANEK